MTTESRRVALGAIALAAVAVFVASRFEITNDITHFLPSDADSSRATWARELASGELSRTLLLVVDAPPGAEARDVAAIGAEFEVALRAEERVAAELAFLEGGPPVGVEAALWELYQPRRFGFLEDAGARTSDAGIDAALRDMRDTLATPMSALVSRVAPGDPWLVLPSVFEGLQSSGAEDIVIVDGRFLAADERAAVLFLGTRSASFDAAAMRPFIAGVQAAFARVDERHGGELALSFAGAARFALHAEAGIRSDVRRVSWGSIIGVTLLLVALFGSLRLVAITIPVLASGFLVGTAACLLAFGRIHGITLAFGAALIGVSIDYTIHVSCHQLLARDPRGARQTLEQIWAGLSLGAATTVVGFVALLVSSFPGLREMALFAAAGVAAALAATRVFLPSLMAVEPRVTPLAQRVVGSVRRIAVGPRGVLAAPVVLAVVVSAVGLSQVVWNDDVAGLQRLDPELLAEDAAVRSRVAPYEQGHLVVAVGADIDQALATNDRVALALRDAQDAGEVVGVRSLAALLPSPELQRRRDAVVREDETLWARVAAALAREGFVVDAFEPLRVELESPAPEPLLWSDVTATPMAALVRPFRVALGDEVAVLSFVHGISDEAALAVRVDAIEGAALVDIAGELGRAYGVYRERMTQLLLVGLLAVLALVALRYRAWRPTLVATLPALLAASTTVALLALGGFELNLLSLVALLMVVSMGVDYGVFLSEAGESGSALDATHLAVVVASVSTTLGFGFLALCDHPALFAIGAPAALGVLLSAVLAVTMRALVLRLAKSPRS